MVIESDTWTREKKLREFKKQFLGTSPAGVACRILNEDDLDLEFIEGNATLVASSDVPIRIRNNVLGYIITYELTEFSAKYDRPNRNNPYCRYVYYEGQSFYENLSNNPKSLVTYTSQRENSYLGSSLHFFRALEVGELKEQGFKLSDDSGFTSPVHFVNISRDGDNTIVKFKRNFYLRYLNGKSSLVVIKDRDIPIIIYDVGNYSPAQNIEFNGELALERIGDALPLNYELMRSKS